MLLAAINVVMILYIWSRMSLLMLQDHSRTIGNYVERLGNRSYVFSWL